MSVAGETYRRTTEVETFKVYKERWYITMVFSLLQITNGALWINFTSVANIAAVYFDTTYYYVNWFSMAIFVTFGPVVFFAMWLVDIYGLRLGLYLCCALNVIGSLIRAVGTLDVIPQASRYMVALIGQFVASCMLPMIMTMPTKLAQDWFPTHQRTLCTTICVMTSVIGSALGTFIPSLIVHTSSDIPLMNFIFCGCGVVAGLTGLFCRRSRPLTPPSSSAKQLLETTIRKAYLSELKIVLTNGRLLMFLVASGAITISLFSATTSVLQQMMCPWGYSNVTVGICNGLLNGLGIPSSVLCIYLTERTKKLQEIVKICFGLQIPAYAALIFAMGVPSGEYILPVLCALVSLLTTGLIPICLELAVEDMYPVDESITSGLMIMFGQVQAAIFISLMSLLYRPLTAEQVQRQTCDVEGSTEAYNMTYSGLLMIGFSAFYAVLVIAFYRPKYRRMEAEQREEQNTEISTTPDHIFMVNL